MDKVEISDLIFGELRNIRCALEVFQEALVYGRGDKETYGSGLYLLCLDLYELESKFRKLINNE